MELAQAEIKTTRIDELLRLAQQSGMDRFQAITTFARVVESGSFVRAAERLDVSVSAVSRAVADLEAHVQARLLNRTTRRLSLTEAGRAFYDRSVQLLADLEEAEQAAHAGTAKPRGTLRITCATSFGVRHLAPAAASFLARFPDMRLDVELSDRAADLVDEGFDLAVRIGAIGSHSLVGRLIASTRLVCCAAPSYLARLGEPQHPEDLVRHVCLTYEYAPSRNTWRFVDGKGVEHAIRIGGRLHANNGRFLEAMAAEGLGIVAEPDFIVGPDVRAGRLVPILRDYAFPASPLYVVYPSRRHLSAKVRAFTDHLAQAFATPAWSLDAAAH
jgi:DNA-binding transcriptional LysR family regulator